MQSTECIVLNIKVVLCLRYDGIKVSTSSTIKEIYSVILLKTIEKRHSHGNGRDSTREMSRIWWQTIGLFTISCTLDVSTNTSKCKHTYSIQSWAPSNAKQLSASVATRMWLFTSSPKINEIFIELDLSLSMAISMLISIHSKWLYSYHTHRHTHEPISSCCGMIKTEHRKSDREMKREREWSPRAGDYCFLCR